MLWTSSIARIIFPKDLHSSINPFTLDSNCPLNCVPATSEVISIKYTSLFTNLLGTSPLAIASAKALTIAVLPTPGSPIKAGLFLLRLFSIWIIRSSSTSLPITLSRFPCLAFSVKFSPKVSRYFFFFFFLSFLLPLEFLLSSFSCSFFFFGMKLLKIFGKPKPPWSSLSTSASLSISLKLLSIESNWADIFSISSSDILVISFMIFAKGSIPCFLAHSKQSPVVSLVCFPSLSSLFINITAIFFLHTEHSINFYHLH